eukprot:6482017-Pyramimonas_sp.AAC.1
MEGGRMPVCPRRAHEVLGLEGRGARAPPTAHRPVNAPWWNPAAAAGMGCCTRAREKSLRAPLVRIISGGLKRDR